MKRTKKINLLINLPPDTFACPELRGIFKRLAAMAVVRRTSANTPEEIVKDLPWADAVIMWSWPVLDAALLAKAPRLKFLGQLNSTQRTARAAFKRGLPISEARKGWSPAVAEMALTLMLAGLRKTSAYHIAMRAGTEEWVKSFPSGIDPRERQLTGRAVGIVGFGGIGQRLAQLLAPFNVKLRVYDPFLPKAVAKQYGAQLVPLMQLLRASEIVVLCAAQNKASERLIGPKQIQVLRKDCVLVNVSRASLIDMQALTSRLRKGDMTAMLDVFEHEPLETDAPLRRMKNAFLTPHRAGGLMESVQRLLTMLVDDLEASLKGKPRKHVLTEAMLPSLPD